MPVTPDDPPSDEKLAKAVVRDEVPPEYRWDSADPFDMGVGYDPDAQWRPGHRMTVGEAFAVMRREREAPRRPVEPRDDPLGYDADRPLEEVAREMAEAALSGRNAAAVEAELAAFRRR